MLLAPHLKWLIWETYTISWVAKFLVIKMASFSHKKIYHWNSYESLNAEL